MVFYKIEAMRDMPENENDLCAREKKAICSKLSERSESFFQKSAENMFIATTAVRDATATFTVIAKTAECVTSQFEEFITDPIFQITSYKIEEITFSSLHSLLHCSERNSLIEDAEQVLECFEIDQLAGHHGLAFGEALINDTQERCQLEEIATRHLFGETLRPELARIYTKTHSKNVLGHPVHYLLQSDNNEVRKTIYQSLLSALYQNGRLKNRRYSFVNFHGNSRLPGESFEMLYKSSAGGAVIIRCLMEQIEENEFGNRGSEILAVLAEIAMKYKQDVLTVFCLPKAARNVKESFLCHWGNVAFVELHEDVVFGENAVAYLKGLCKENHIRCDKQLTDKIETEKGYTGSELNQLFDEWHQKKLCNSIYPQYKTTEPIRAKIKEEKSRGSAYDTLQQLIGLNNAKGVINQVLNYFRIQKLFADKGLKNEQPSMHMVFTGNPGTAKTTVARLFAEIMKENALLEDGCFYEVGRADLVGKYVGHTAPLVKAAFKKAKGGVLFIDEAYSLVDDRDGLFGDEAINTIVQEMENNRKDTIVIFAGYPDKMENFLNKNPGLRSRIAFHIPFEDYNAEELCEIAELIAREKGLHIESAAKEKLAKIFETAAKFSDFGNGRYARNMIEKAKMAQADRLIHMEFEKITEKDVFTLVADDFEFPAEKAQEKVIKIGFCA